MRNDSETKRHRVGFFMHNAILSEDMLDSKTKEDVKLNMFVENIATGVGGDSELITFKSIDLDMDRKMILWVRVGTHSGQMVHTGKFTRLWCVSDAHMESYMGELPYR